MLNTQFCIKCSSEDIEDRYFDEINHLRYYMCFNCGLVFSSYDYYIAYKIKEKIFALQNEETTFKTIMDSSIEALTERGVGKFIEPSVFQSLANNNFNLLDSIYKVSFLEGAVEQARLSSGELQ